MTCDFQQCGILTSVDSDAPVQPPFDPFTAVYNADNRPGESTAILMLLFLGYI